MRISDWSSDVCSSDLTNYTNNDYSMSLDADAGATPSTFIGGAAFDFIVVLKNESRQVSQELRLDGTSGPLSWVTGLFYYRDAKSSLQDYVLRSFGVKRLNTGELKTNSYAAFDQLDARLSDQLTMSIGGRNTNEHHEITDSNNLQPLAQTN